jgi:glycosyltransferase A (GT-A) superfamily protein (DUF2064 family)
MTDKKANDTVLAICIQEVTEDGSELNIGDQFSSEDISYLHQGFIADTLVNVLGIPNLDLRLYYADLQHTKKSVDTIVNYLSGKLKGKRAKNLKSNLTVAGLSPDRWGVKMDAIFRDCFDLGYKHVVFIGSRTPTLQDKMIKLAVKLLKKSDAVFGPTVEGRYYLLGMSGEYHVDLASYDWRSPNIYSEVVAGFQDKGLSWTEMEMWYAVEHPEDIEYLVRDINQYRLEGDELSTKETEKVLERLIKRQI